MCCRVELVQKWQFHLPKTDSGHAQGKHSFEKAHRLFLDKSIFVCRDARRSRPRSSKARATRRCCCRPSVQKTIGFVLRPSFLSADILKTITLPRREHEQQTQGEILFRKERARLFMQAPTSITFASTARQEEFRPFFCAQLPFCCTENATILPRQARDKHTSMKSTQKREWGRVPQTVLHTVTSSGDLRSENAPTKLFYAISLFINLHYFTTKTNTNTSFYQDRLGNANTRTDTERNGHIHNLKCLVGRVFCDRITSKECAAAVQPREW